MEGSSSQVESKKTSLVLGIDTGGTYTDGVLLEYHSRQVLASCKSLTTKRDFSIGIEEVIAGIHIEDPASVKMVSISTTLATNAIAEGKGKQVALLLIGYDPDLITSFNMADRFATPHYFYFTGGHDLYGREQAPLDLTAILDKVTTIKDQVDALAVSSYFSPLNPEHENRVYDAIARICDLPVVLGHQLSTKLGSVERATTAALNASLLAVLQDFIIAVRRAMERRHIDAPLMVVRGDGTLMSDVFAARTPVETIHSGPAASAIGGRFLSHLDEALVVDIGGTTTDIALIQGGQVRVSEEGATVGDYKTAVKAANLLSIALGGDSHIGLDRENAVVAGPERVVPLAFLAHQYPPMVDRLKVLAQRSRTQTATERLEHWFLLRKPQDESTLENEYERKLVAYLAKGPQPLADILQRFSLLHKAHAHAKTFRLLQREIIGKAGLTPTDLLHVEGRFAPWDVEAARLAQDALARFLYLDPTDLRQQVWSLMTETIFRAIVFFLSGKRLPPPSLPIDHDMGRWFFHNSLHNKHPQLETRIRLRQPLIGIGAPAGILLQEVAGALHTELVLPPYHQVANAVGAIAGSVMVAEEILVYPHLSSDGLEVLGYYVQASDQRLHYEEVEQALDQAQCLSQERALGAAIRSGAENPQVWIDLVTDGLDTYRVRAKAVGNPRLAR
jgi:N-methylhydantoinase A/oxoprolinase/acetone carboxylase beta subunit